MKPTHYHRSNPIRALLSCLFAALAAGCSFGFRPQPYYASAASRDRDLHALVETRSFALGRPTSIQITPDGSSVLFLRSGPRDRKQDLYEQNVKTGQSRVLLTAAKLLGDKEEKLTVQEKARRERQRVTVQGLTSYQISEDGSLLLVPFSGKLYVIERASDAVHELSGVKEPIDPRLSPDGRCVAYVSENDLYSIDWRSGLITRLTTGGTEDTPNGVAEFVAQEEMKRSSGYWWSPDSAALAYQSSDLREVEKLFIPDPAHPYKEPQAWRYPRAGARNATVKLHVVPASGGTAANVQWDDPKFPYLAAVRWEKNSPLTILVQTRDQKDELLLRVDPATGNTTELLHEHDDAWINLFDHMPRWLESGRGFLWITERDGERRIWLHDADGKPQRVLNDDTFRLRDLVDVDETGRRLWVTGHTDPTETHVYELSLDLLHVGPALSAAGSNSLKMSKDHRVRVVGFTGPRSLTTYRVIADAQPATHVLPDAAESPAQWPNVEFTRVGPHDEFDVAIVRPRNFNRFLKYPVIDDVYGGPSEGVVHKSAGTSLLRQWYADQGFIVVAIDNRGIENRGRAWERAIYCKLGDVPLDDQVAGLKALGAKYREMDMSRVGIKGWSFGGYLTAMAAIRRGDVFAAGVAGAPPADWLDYDTHYTERYLNTPQADPAGYRASSVLSYADQLHRPLLIFHGTSDDNVYFGNSLRLTDALVRAGRPFEFVPLSGYTHLVPDAAMKFIVESRTAAFFRKHLRGEPG